MAARLPAESWPVRRGLPGEPDLRPRGRRSAGRVRVEARGSPRASNTAAPRRSAGKAAMSLIGPEGRKQLQVAARFASAGLELALAIVVGYFGGRFLDG